MIKELVEFQSIFRNKFRSHDEMISLQNRKLRSVIRHAYENVPYYTSLFDKESIKPGDVRTVEDLQLIPTSTKEDFIAAGCERTVTKDTYLPTCTTRKTSGSSGKPFTIYLSKGDSIRRRLILFRSLRHIGFRVRDRLAVLGGRQPEPIRFHQRLGFFRSLILPPTLPVDKQREQLERFNPTVLWAYPTALRKLLHSINFRLGDIIQPRILITAGEVFDEVLRKSFLENLDIEVFNLYGAQEFGLTAFECMNHSGLHVLSDHVIQECCTDEIDSSPHPPGVAIITTLNAYVMPFIRYRVGDVFHYTNKKCTCAMTSPLICAPSGREKDRIILPSGKVLYPGDFKVLSEFPSIDQFRLIQQSSAKFLLQLVTDIKPDDETISKIRSRVSKFLEDPVELDIRFVNFIIDEDLKFKIFVPNIL
ncbi:MAG: hypothetical protein ABGX16_12520 [Pirellulales bacterium]